MTVRYHRLYVSLLIYAAVLSLISKVMMSITASTIRETPVNIQSTAVDANGLDKMITEQTIEITALIAARNHFSFFRRSISTVH